MDVNLYRLYAHTDDCFSVDKPSGMSSVRLISIDEKSANERQLNEIRRIISARKIREMWL